MDLLCNVDTGVFQSSITDQQPIQFLNFKRRDTATLNLYFVKNGANYDNGEVNAGLTSFSCALKSAGDYASAFLAYASNYSSYNTGDSVPTFYTFKLNLNTSELDAIFTTDAEISSIATMLEFQWVSDSDNSVYSSQTLPVIIANDVIRGDEPVLAQANPSYPDATSVFSYGAFATAAAFPATGVLNKLYQAQDTNFLYTWTGSAYTRIQSTILTGSGSPDSTLGTIGDLYYDSAAYNLYQKGSTSWNLVGNLRGATGETGSANSLSVGTVSSLSVGTSATASITGTAPTQTLNLGIPIGATGATGATGPANSLSVGTVSTNAGTAASASITGTAPSQTLNLGLPATTLSIGTVSTGAAGSSASASITGTAPTQTLALTIPRGSPGTGATAVVSSANFTAATGTCYVTTATLTVSDPASASTGDNYQVIIGAGTCTIGGVAYAPSRIEVVRYYNGSAWVTSPSVHSDNLTLNGTANTAPSQTATSDSSLMTRLLAAQEPFWELGRCWRINGTAGLYSAGTGTLTPTLAAGMIAQLKSPYLSAVAATGTTNVVLSSSSASFNSGSGSSSLTFLSGIGVAYRFYLSAGANWDATVRFVIGGNHGTTTNIPYSDQNALTSYGFGVEFGNGGTTNLCYRLFGYGSGGYVSGSTAAGAGAWTSTGVTYGSVYQYYPGMALTCSGGVISLYLNYTNIWGTRLPSTATATLSGGPNAVNTSGNNLCVEFVSSSTGTVYAASATCQILDVMALSF